MKSDKVFNEYAFLYPAFVALWWRSGAAGEPLPVFEGLVKRYREVGRRYHTLEHIEHCFRELEGVRHLVSDRNAVEFFIFFHDAVYDVGRKNNEERSASLFAQTAHAAGLPWGLTRKVVQLILLSESHRAYPESDPDALLALDIDMSILGADAPVYDAYARAIREEYGMYTDKEFAIGRVGWIFRTLDSQPIFLTEVFRKKYEERAVANLKEELVQLQNRQ